jgi:ABC-2 type transport system ATP-binding protein
MDTAVVRVQGLTKVYTQAFRRHPVPAVTDVDLEVAPGEIFGLLGPNGAGKTTLVKILLGIVRPTEGRADLFGVPAADPRSRRRIGFLPENHRFPEFMTPGQLLDHYGRLAGVPAEDRRRRIPELLERVRMGKWKHVRIKKFSKGMMQRVGLAQALLNRPALVFLDEPTDGVDPVGRAAIREMVAELKARGVTVFINSHLLMEVEMMCDRIVILADGRILREGTIGDFTALTGAVRFDVAEVPEDLERLLDGIGQDLHVDGRSGHASFELSVDEAGTNAAIDRLRARGVAIRGVTPRKLSLEEAFIDLVGKEVS